MSILRSKHSGWTHEGRRTPYFGGGGGGGTTQSTGTTYQTNIPEYARPYVETMLGATQKQLFTFGNTPDRQVQIGTDEGGQPIYQTIKGDQGEITGFKPYQPYSTDPTKYVAGFQPLQEQAMRATGQLGVPSQYGTATGLAGTAGMGGLGAAQQAGALGQQALGYGATGAQYGATGAEQALARAQQTARQAGIYGGMGAGYGARGVQAAEQGFGAGEAFARQATDPYATAAYMSPYMQNVVDYQKTQALRDYNIGQGLRRAQAVGAGAFGGSRQAIAEAEAERALGSQLQGIAAQGSQKAFEDAQRQQQFGAQLGLQGLQAGYGGLGMGMQGAGLGLQGVGAQQAAGQLGLAGTAQGMQGAQAGLQGVQGAIGAGQYGLSGLGQATQAAGTLGQLGGAELGAQKDIIGLQSQLGAQQQAREQQIINQAIQDWANTQQYPLMQLGVMSNMLRGLPMQSATTNQYVAAPNYLTQGIGTIGALGSLGNVFRGGKEGGLPSEFKPTTGIKSYDVGGSVKGKLYDMSPDELQDYIKESSSPIAKRLAEEVLRDKVGKASGGIIAFKDRGEVEDPEMVRQAYIDAARMKADADKAPTAIKPPSKIQALNQEILDRGSSLPKDFPSELSYEADKARADFQQKVIEQGGQPKPRQMGTSTTPMTDAERIAGFKAALNQTRAAAPAPENTIPGTTTTTNVPQGTRTAPTPSAAPAPAAAPSTTAAAPTPAPAGITSALRTGNPELDRYIASTLAEANKPEKTISEIAAERKAYIGPDEFTPKERARLMAEKANAKEEATRQNWMRMAEFFATWGSTPGNSIAAGLVALKNKVPDFIADSKEQKKILRDIDASITGLDKAERLERAGEFDKAAELKQKLSSDLKGKVGNVLTFAASNLSSQRTLEAAKVRAEGTGGGDDKVLNNLMTRRTAIQGKINDVRKENKILVMQAEMANPENSPRIAEIKKKAQDQLDAKLEASGLLSEYKQVNSLIDQMSRVQATGTTTTPSAKPTSTAPGGKLVQNKDGSFTYAPQ